MTERRVSHYDIEAPLGEGGMGKVFRARDLNLDRLVALKFLGARLTDPSFKDRFRREARLAAQLNHPNIATIYEFGEDGDQAFIAMELVEGETLEEKIRRAPLSLTQVRQWGAQAAHALAAAHALGIVHRDIKPANLMVTRDGRLKVMDFGVARRTGETSLTMEGHLVGTVNIMAPETLKGDAPTNKSDLFSLGCVLYEALSGKSPFPGDDVMQILYQVRNEEPRPVRTLRPDVPEDLAELVHGLLDKDPETRLGPAELVAAQLSGEAPVGDVGGTRILSVPTAVIDAKAAAQGTAVRTGTAVAEPPKRPAGRRGFVIAGVGVVVVALGFLGSQLMHRGPRDDPRAVMLNDQAVSIWEESRGVADSLARADSLDRAESMFFEATQVDPDYAVPWNNLASLYLQRKKLRQASNWLRDVLDTRPDYAIALGNLALVLEESSAVLRAEDPDQADQLISEAKAMYQKAIRTEKSSPYPWNNLAYLYIRTGEPGNALPLLGEAMTKFPGEAALYKNRGWAYLVLGQKDAAERDFTRAAELNFDYVMRVAHDAEATDVALARALWEALREQPATREQAEAALARLGAN